MPPIRILITDDYPDWRRQVRLLLQARPEWQVIAEARDGSEAVQKVEELKPDLILLDIGLPKLNGIEAAWRIRQLFPSSKIVFLSQNNDRDVVRAALSAGALGYVHKTDAEGELLIALDAVLRNKQSVSSSLRDSEFTGISGEKAPHRHEVLFYSDDAVLLDGFTRFIVAALKAGNVAVVLVTEPHRNNLVLRLKAEGVDVDAATRLGTYIQLDVAKTLSTFMVNEMPDVARFFEVASALIQSAGKVVKGEHSRVVVCGEGVGVLWAEGKADAAIRLEQLWEKIGTTFDVDILCAYASSSFHGEEDKHVFQSICADHSAAHSQ